MTISASIEKLLEVRISEIEKLNIREKEEYFLRIKEYCKQLNKGIKTNITFSQKCISSISKKQEILI